MPGRGNWLEIRKGKRTRIIRRISNSLPIEFTFTAEPLNPDQALTGEVEIRGSHWIFPKAPQTAALGPLNRVAKSAWDSFYSVYVTPGCDVRIHVDSAAPALTAAMLIAALVVTAAAAAAVYMGLN